MGEDENGVAFGATEEEIAEWQERQMRMRMMRQGVGRKGGANGGRGMTPEEQEELWRNMSGHGQYRHIAPKEDVYYSQFLGPVSHLS